VIPDQDMLAEAYRRKRQSAYLKQHFGELLERSRQHIADLDIPVDLHGETKRSVIMEAAKEAGYTEASIRQAKTRKRRDGEPEVLGDQIGFQGNAYWRLQK
jgi:hypothetical protein